MTTGGDDAVGTDAGQRLRDLARSAAQDLLNATTTEIRDAAARRYLDEVGPLLEAAVAAGQATAAMAAATARDRLAIQPLEVADVQAAVSELNNCASILTSFGGAAPEPEDPCDFCRREVTRHRPNWIYPVQPSQLAGLAPQRLAGAALDIGWLSCDSCADRVEEGDYAELARRMGSADGTPPRALRMFRDNRAGEAVPIR
ncbi:hypothetical protein [Actinokineospora enzanensis]|uniref:hypothetical protein n=1 Tax=Actinokineospora enzanensis TaxID=155975 RepID=UPI00035F0E68|nr:hypothetical protein [Actinokineospora enzanensis]